MKKCLVLVGAIPAAGKTCFSKALCTKLHNTVYLDKDAIIPLTKMIYAAADEPYNRDSDFFRKYARDAEYEAILSVAFEALEFNKVVLVNAPFSKEFRNPDWINETRLKLKEEYDCELITIWVTCPIEIIHERMIKRNSERDVWKLAHWDEYIKRQNLITPTIEGIFEVDTTSDETQEEGLQKVYNYILQ